MGFQIDQAYNLATGGNDIIRELTSGSTTIAATADTAMTLSFATVSGYHYSPGKVLACYSAAAPTTGKVSVTNFAGSTTYWASEITAQGPAPFDWDEIMLPISTGMKVTIAAGGGSSIARLNCAPYRIKGNGQ